MKRNANGARNQFYDNMELVARGDVVFSYYGTRIQNVGVVTSPAESAPKPAFGSGAENWADEGWLVGVEFSPVDNPFRPKDEIERIRDLLPTKYSPLRPSGDGLQSVYLASISAELADVLIELAESEQPAPLVEAEPDPPETTPKKTRRSPTSRVAPTSATSNESSSSKLGAAKASFGPTFA